MRNFIAPGKTLRVPTSTNLTSGTLMAVGKIVGVCQHDSDDGYVDILTEGVFTFETKVKAENWARGAAIYFVSATGDLTTGTGAGGHLIGYAIEDASAGTSHCVVRLIPSAA